GADLRDDASAARHEFARSVEVLDGHVDLRVVLEPRGGATARAGHGGLDVQPATSRGVPLHLRASRPLDGLTPEWQLVAGEHVDVVLSWGGSHRHHRFDASEMLAATADAWRRWLGSFSYAGPEAALVRRAAITLKLCDHWVNGALVAAPTASLPAPV